MTGPLDTIRTEWGGAAPDWVVRLAQECEATSQARVATRLDRSSSLISNVLHKKYPGDMASVEDLVRGAFMASVVNCPALGEIATDMCQGWRKKTRTFAGHNALRVTMYRACNRCPRNTGEQP